MATIHKTFTTVEKMLQPLTDSTGRSRSEEGTRPLQDFAGE